MTNEGVKFLFFDPEYIDLVRELKAAEVEKLQGEFLAKCERKDYEKYSVDENLNVRCSKCPKLVLTFETFEAHEKLHHQNCPNFQCFSCLKTKTRWRSHDHEGCKDGKKLAKLLEIGKKEEDNSTTANVSSSSSKHTMEEDFHTLFEMQGEWVFTITDYRSLKRGEC